MKTPSEVLRDAAEEVKTRGWTRYSLQNEIGQVCAVGALRLASFGVASKPSNQSSPIFMNHENNRSYRRATRVLQKVMREQLSLCRMTSETYTTVPRLNDLHVKSGEELITYMEKAANQLEG